MTAGGIVVTPPAAQKEGLDKLPFRDTMALGKQLPEDRLVGPRTGRLQDNLRPKAIQIVMTELYRCIVLLRKFPLAILVLVLVATACASPPKNQIMLMPAPDVFDQGAWDPFTDHDPIAGIPYGGILYATDREPDRGAVGSYRNERGQLLRLGIARISAGEEGMTWQEARRISLLKERPEDFPLVVTGVEEVEILDTSINPFTRNLVGEKGGAPDKGRFAALVDAKLAISEVKDVYIYVHGYKVVFENPLLVASELWHFLGYDGVFIAFSWPSTPNTLAYFADLETGSLSAGNLRLLLRHLAEDTRARRIHIIGYSAGTRLVTEALHQLALLQAGADGCGSRKSLRIGNVILAASDVDRHLFGSYLVDGILDAVEDITLYVSAKDEALGMSDWVFGRSRLGEVVEGGLPTDVADFLRRNEELVVVDASDAPGAAAGNGHAYFRQSPFTSSDILTTLRFGFKPQERGLVQVGARPIWTFPEDYISRLRKTLADARSPDRPQRDPSGN